MAESHVRKKRKTGTRPAFSFFPYSSGWLVTFLLTLLILYPLASVIIQAVFPGIFFGDLKIGQLGLLLDIFRLPLWRQSLVNSLILGLGTMILATMIGCILAAARTIWSFRTAQLLDLAVWVLLITPSFIIAQGWLLFASAHGIAANMFGWTWLSPLIFQPAGLIMIMSLCKFPFAYLTIRGALEWKVAGLSGAARLCGAGTWTVWQTIRLPLILPAIFAGAALVFMDTIGDFGLPASLAAIYRFPTLPYSIYSAIYTSPIRFDMAGVLSFYLVLFIVLAMCAQYLAMRKAHFDFMTSNAEISQASVPGRKGWLLTMGNILFLLLVVGIPLGTNVMVSVTKNISDGLHWSNITWMYYMQVAADKDLLWTGLQHSLLIAGTAALTSLVIGYLIAYVLLFSRFRYKKFIDMISLVSLAVPGVVLGIGYIFVWNQNWLESFGLLLYGTPAILVLASVAGTIPIISRMLLGSLTKVSKTLFFAAELQGAGFGRINKDILLPLIRGSLLSAVLAAFGSSVFDLATNSILYPPDFSTLPVTINQAFEDLHFGYATAATISGSTVVVVIIITVELLFRRRKRSS